MDRYHIFLRLCFFFFWFWGLRFFWSWGLWHINIPLFAQWTQSVKITLVCQFPKGSVYLYSCANNSVVICTGTLPRSIHFTLSSRLPLFVYTLQLTALQLVRCWRRCHAHWGGRGWDQHQLPRGSMTSCPTLPCTLRRSRVRPKPTPSRSTMSFRTLLAHCCHGHYGGGGRDQHQLPRVNDELPNSANVRGALNWKGG